ncbi:hypothetical protein DV704_11285 [Meiothermus sp. QL-1]|uniref:YncE family protein n=1 Tax=Meiothermus sp. QL-1 TaxID=2058095 RepID=UPI000E0AE117|nr:hypothetical protein [Meiothermus sp. QL-1]RDI94570.1 hypothetical protein DV704_11285 [Meiothermus sp. QL-1]
MPELNRRTVLKTLGAAAIAAAQPAQQGRAQVGSVVWSDYVVFLNANAKAFIVDTRTDQVVASLDTARGATLGSMTPDGTKVYVSGAGEGETRLVVLDMRNLRVAKVLETGNRPKHGLVSPDGRRVGVDHWGLSEGKLRLVFIRTSDDSIEKTIEIPVQNQPKGVTSMHNAWSWDSRFFYTLDRVDDRLVVVDTADWSVRTFPSPSVPHYPCISPDGKELWLIHEGNAQVRPGIVVYDLTRPDLPVIARMEMPLIGEDAVEAHHGNFTQDGRYFMALNRGPGNNLRGREVAFFGARTKRLVHRLSCASTGVGHAYNTPDGRRAIATNYGNNVITVIDIPGLRTLKDLVIGKGRMGHVVFTKDGRFGYLSNADGNLYKLDMRSLEVVKTIETGLTSGGGQVINVWTNIFEELPRA